MNTLLCSGLKVSARSLAWLPSLFNLKSTSKLPTYLLTSASHLTSPHSVWLSPCPPLCLPMNLTTPLTSQWPIWSSCPFLELATHHLCMRDGAAAQCAGTGALRRVRDAITVSRSLVVSVASSCAHGVQTFACLSCGGATYCMIAREAR